MKKYILLIFAVITFILSSCATGMRGYRYNNDFGYNTPGQGMYSYGYDRHRSKRDRKRDYRYHDYDYRYQDRDYDYYGNGYGYIDRNQRYDDSRYNDRYTRHHHKRLKGFVIVF